MSDTIERVEGAWNPGPYKLAAREEQTESGVRVRAAGFALEAVWTQAGQIPDMHGMLELFQSLCLGVGFHHEVVSQALGYYDQPAAPACEPGKVVEPQFRKEDNDGEAA